MEKYPSLVEGTGLENREVGNGAGVRIPLSPPLIFIYVAYKAPRPPLERLVAKFPLIHNYDCVT